MLNKKKGFTLAELLIVIAIIGVLVGIAIPVLNSQLEKSRKAKDLHTARSIESVLAAAVNDGTIELAPAERANQASGILVIVTRDKDSWPEGYDTKTYPTYFCGMNKTIKINGKVNNKEYSVFNEDLNNILNGAGFSSDIKVASNNKNGDESWDWIVIEIAYMDGKAVSRIFSGFTGKTSNMYALRKDVTNIEKMIG